MFESYSIEDVPEEVRNEIIFSINSDSSTLDSFLLKGLILLNETITELKKENCLVASSVAEYILTFKFSVKVILTVIESNEDSIKITPSAVESIKINCNSILNAIENISELQKKQLEKLTPEELLVALTT